MWCERCTKEIPVEEFVNDGPNDMVLCDNCWSVMQDDDGFSHGCLKFIAGFATTFIIFFVCLMFIAFVKHVNNQP